MRVKVFLVGPCIDREPWERQQYAQPPRENGMGGGPGDGRFPAARLQGGSACSALGVLR